MKKLLSILASLVVAGSSATAVVACSNNVTQDGKDDGYYPDSNNDGPEADHNGAASGEGVTPTNPTNNGSNSSNSDNGTHDSGYTKLTPATQSEIAPAAEKYAQKEILQDQFGINGNYLDRGLFDGVSPKYRSHNEINMSNKGTYGSSSFPLMDWLRDQNILDQDTYKTVVDTVLPLVVGTNGEGGIKLPNPSQLGATVSSLAPMLSLFSSTIKDALNKQVDVKDSSGNTVGKQTEKNAIKGTAQKLLTPEIGNAIIEFLKTGPSLRDEYKNLTVGQSMDSFIIAATYVLGRLAHADEKEISAYSEPWKTDQLSSATPSLAKYIMALIANSKKKDADPTKFKIDFLSILDSTTIGVVSDAVKLFSMYVEQFDEYKTTNATLDSANIFADPKDPTKVLANYYVINKVRSEKISDTKFKFNPLKFASDLSYYFGDLDKPEGIFRFQALIAMFFLDDDKSSASWFLFNWNDSGANVAGWDENVDGVSKNATSLSRTLMSVIKLLLDELIPDNIGDTLKGSGVTSSKVNNGGGKTTDYKPLEKDEIVNFVKRSTYILIQSIAWNKPFRLSNQEFMHVKESFLFDKNIRLSDLYDGIGLIIPGLKQMSEWTKLQNEGFLNYLYDGNVYDLLEEFKTNGSYKTFFGILLGILSSALGADKVPTWDKIIDTVQGVQDKIKPYTQEAIVKETITLQDAVKKYDKITFENDNQQSILNTSLKGGKATHEGESDIVGKTGTSSGIPEITNVVKTSYNQFAGANGQTTLMITAKNILTMTDSAGKDVQHYHWFEGQPKTDPSVNNTSIDFAKSISVAGHNVVSSTLIGDLDGDKSARDHTGTFSVVVDGDVKDPNTMVTAYGWRYNGYDGYWDWRKVGMVTTDEYYNQCKLTFDTVNMVWAKDDLNMNDSLGWTFSGDDWKDKDSFDLSQTDVKRLKDLKIIGTKDGEDTNILKSSTPTPGTAINIQMIMSNNLSWLLGAIGLEQFNNFEGPLGLPVLQDNSIAGLVLKIGALINRNIPYISDSPFLIHGEDVQHRTQNQIQSDALDSIAKEVNLDQLQNLVKAIFGLNESGNNNGPTDIISKTLDALTEKNVDSNKVKSILGIDDANTYSATGLFGSLIAMFTPSLKADNSGTIKGNSTAETPLWDYLFGTIKSAWELANDSTNTALLNGMAKGVKIDWDNAVEDEKKNVTVGITYSYKYTKYVKGTDKDGNPTVDAEDVTVEAQYTLVISNIVQGQNQDYTITKIK